MPRARSLFELDSVEEDPPLFEEGGVRYLRARLGKVFSGDIEGTSEVEMLSVRSEAGGAGYVALERIAGVVQGKRGTFALLHVGTTTNVMQWGRWPVVTGSGTGELSGISGEARIEIAPDGAHTLYLDYEIDQDANAFR